MIPIANYMLSFLPVYLTCLRTMEVFLCIFVVMEKCPKK